MTNWQKIIKPTKSRILIYEIVANAQKPLSASAIFELVKQVDAKIWLSTIYRTLEIFVQHNIFIKYEITINNETLSIYQLNNQKHTHFAICTNCNKLIAILNCPIDNSNLVLEEDNFIISSHKMEIYGLCHDCQSSIV